MKRLAQNRQGLFLGLGTRLVKALQLEGINGKTEAKGGICVCIILASAR